MINESTTNEEILNAFQNALKDNDIKLIEQILNLKSENKLSLEQLEKAVVGLSSEILEKIASFATAGGRLDIMLSIFKMPNENRLSEDVFLPGIVAAMDSGQWGIVQEMINFEGKNSFAPNIVRVVIDLAKKDGVTLTLPKERDEQFTHIIGCRLGLLGVHFESLNSALAAYSSSKRFNESREKILPCPESITPPRIINTAKTAELSYSEKFLTGEDTILNLVSSWKGHTFGVSLIKENNELHVVYTNRGDKPWERGEAPVPVVVYTLKTAEEKKIFLQQMETALGTEDRDEICRFFRGRDVTSKINPELSRVFAKAPQKTGNCAFANTNIFWHFTLAQEFRKLNPTVSLADAYQHVKEDYKKLRRQDRISGFHDLLSVTDASLLHDGVKQYIAKITTRKIDDIEFLKEIIGSLTRDHMAILDSVVMDDGRSAWDYLLSTVIVRYNDNQEMMSILINKFSECPSEKYKIDDLFVNAVNVGFIGLVRCIIDDKIANKLSLDSVKIAMVSALNNDRMDILLDLFKIKGENRPSNAELMPILIAAQSAKKWDFLQEIINIDGENALPDETVALFVEIASSQGKELKLPKRMITDHFSSMKDKLQRIKESNDTEDNVTEDLTSCGEVAKIR